jgi:hypothetical protein
MSSSFFNVAALFIMFREALEAAIIIAVLLQLMEKLKLQPLKRSGEQLLCASCRRTQARRPPPHRQPPPRRPATCPADA